MVRVARPVAGSTAADPKAWPSTKTVTDPVEMPAPGIDEPTWTVNVTDWPNTVVLPVVTIVVVLLAAETVSVPAR